MPAELVQSTDELVNLVLCEPIPQDQRCPI